MMSVWMDYVQNNCNMNVTIMKCGHKEDWIGEPRD